MTGAALAALGILCLFPGITSAQTPKVEDLRDRATAYVEGFVTRFANVVSEEHFLQESSALPSISGTGRDARLDIPTPGRREIRSDFLFVRRQATDDWLVYRDAFEVDGRPVRDRSDRLLTLLTAPARGSQELAMPP